jgi:amino acid adenylation domain-containing protein
MPVIEVAGGPIEYVYMDGHADLAPLVFLHHGIGSVAGWYRLHDRLAAITGRRTMAYTRHGLGGSAPVKLPRSPDYLEHEARVVLPEILGRLGIERPVLIGHSEGAAIAILYASEAYASVAGLVLLAPMVFVEDQSIRAIRSLGNSFSEGTLRPEMATIHADPEAAFTGWYDTWMSPQFRQWSIKDRLSRVVQPVLVVDGAWDDFATATQGDTICAAVAGPVSRVVIPNGTHLVHLTHPQETRQALLDFLRSTDPDRLDKVLSAAATRFPDRPAIAAGDQVLTYSDLDRAVNDFVERLADSGVKPGDKLGIFLQKDIDAVIGIYAGLRLGTTVAPLDPTDPPARVARVIGGAAIRFLVCSESTVEKAKRACDGAALALTGTMWLVATTPDYTAAPDAASEGGGYLLFTSGSTGWPKGVLLSHGNVLHFVRWSVNALGLHHEDRIGSQSSLGFDLSTFDLFASALAGACVELLPEHLRSFPRDLVEWMAARRISVLYAVPSLYQAMLLRGGLEEAQLSALRLAVFAGEPFPPQLLERCVRAIPGARFHNFYGPTETNVCTHEPIPPDWSATDGLSVGRPIEGDFVDAFDEDGCPTSGDGEIYVAGATVFRGYLVNGELQDPTRSLRFRDGSVRRAYPTGDIGCLAPDGRLYLRGRRDSQVKRQGYRIDLHDVENTLLEVAAVDTAAVVSKSVAPHEGEIWAYVVTSESSLQRVQSALAVALPRRMLPDRVVLVAELPMSHRGKIDRRLLSELEA